MVKQTFVHPCHRLVLLVLLGVGTAQVSGQCTLPSALAGAWLRASDGKTIAFNMTDVSNLDIKAGSDTLPSFVCVNSVGDQYMLGTPNKVATASGTNVYGYFCWKLVYLSNQTYLLYQLTAMANSGTFDTYRVFPSEAIPTMAEVCTLQSQLPTLLYKVADTLSTDVDVASIPTAQRQCSPELFATYSYVKDGVDCTGTDSKLDMCVDRETAHINYTACPSKILFSRDGALICAANFKMGDDVYQLLINNDSSVGNSFKRFVCLKVNTTGKPEVATAYPDDCAATAGTQTLTLTPTVTCPIVDLKPKLDILPIIIGVVAGVLVIVIVTVIVVLYKKGYLKRRHRAVTPSKPQSNGSTPPKDNEMGDPTSDEVPSPPPADTISVTTEEVNSSHMATRLPPLGITPTSEALRS